MKKVIKQVLGIDVAQKELVVCFGIMNDDWTLQLLSHKVFTNTAKGFGLLLAWVKKMAKEEVPIRYVMEATGVYHQSFAYYLDDLGLEVSIVLPNKISNYARSLDVKTVTDRTASEAITYFGLERQLELWHRPNRIYKGLSQLTRERNQLVDERTVLKNQLHAEQAEAEPHKKSIQRTIKRITLLNKQEEEIKAELKALLAKDEKIKKGAELLCSISGIGMLTTAGVLGETEGFNLIHNKRQLSSYAGLDVVEKQSGTSIKGKSHISKRGNKHIRRAMHMPALSAIRHDKRYKDFFARLVARHGIKMKAAVAVQRKLLEMMYTVYSTGIPYDKVYMSKKAEQESNKEEIALQEA